MSAFVWTDRDGKRHELDNPVRIEAEVADIAQEMDRYIDIIDGGDRLLRDTTRTAIRDLQRRLGQLRADLARWNDHAVVAMRAEAAKLVEQIDRLPSMIADVLLVVELHAKHGRLLAITADAPDMRARRLAEPMTAHQRQAITACASRTAPSDTATRGEAKTWLDAQPRFARGGPVDGGWFGWVDRKGHAHRLSDPLPIEREIAAVAKELASLRPALSGTGAPLQPKKRPGAVRSRGHGPRGRRVDCIRRRLAVEEEDVVTAYSGPIYGEELAAATAAGMIYPFRSAVGSTQLLANHTTGWFANGADLDGGMVPAAEMQRAADDAIRFPGLRDILVVGHPVVEDLMEKLAADPSLIPAPDDDVVTRLCDLDGFARDGKIITIHGVPVPAGRRQTDYYVVLRWRPLYSPFALPHLIYSRDPAEVRPTDRAALGIAEGDDPDVIHLVDHDARHVTDETQLSLLMFSTALHRDNLVALQMASPALFVALWRRDIAAAWKLGRRMNSADLPASNPKSRIRSRLRRLIYGTALMSEFERLFEIIDTLRAENGVTRDGVKALLLGTSALTGVALIETGEFVAGAVAHARALHPTMDPGTADKTDRIGAAFNGSAIFRSRCHAIRHVAGGMPVRYFLGVEPGMLALVALVHMVEDVKRLEGDHRQPGRTGLGTFDRQDTASVELAVLITSNICLPTARTILQREAKLGGSDDGWALAIVPTLIDNPRLREQVEAMAHKAGIAWPIPGNADCDRKRRHSPYEQAGIRAKLCAFPVGQPGWTQGFRFEAWLRPDAELAFLRNCCRYIQYDPAQAAKRDAHLAARFPDSADAEADAMASDTPLPRQHPLERIQDLFRRFFDRLQVAELAAERASTESRAWREAVLREVAPLLAAVSPITVDPYLSERMIAPPSEAQRTLAREVLWNI